MSTIRVQRVHPDAKLPVRANGFAAGFDLHVLTEGGAEIYLAPGAIHRFTTGLAIELPPGTFGDIRSRSSSFMRGISVCGTIDEDYRGEAYVVAANVGFETVVIKHLTRIAQLIVTPYVAPDAVWSTGLTETERGSKGFGSSGQ